LFALGINDMIIQASGVREVKQYWQQMAFID